MTLSDDQKDLIVVVEQMDREILAAEIEMTKLDQQIAEQKLKIAFLKEKRSLVLPNLPGVYMK